MSDLQKLEAMRNCNWTPASVYYKRKLDHANMRLSILTEAGTLAEQSLNFSLVRTLDKAFKRLDRV